MILKPADSKLYERRSLVDAMRDRHARERDMDVREIRLRIQIDQQYA